MSKAVSGAIGFAGFAPTRLGGATPSWTRAPTWTWETPRSWRSNTESCAESCGTSLW